MERLVSIIMPCYNSASFIAEAIGSILGQTYVDWELLVMDDGSTDDTLSIVRRLQEGENRILLHTSVINKGVSYQMNKGIGLAKGKYICRMDSDDISSPARIAEQFDFMERMPDACLCTTDYKLFHSQGAGGCVQVKCPGGFAPIRVELLKDLPVCGPSFFARRELFGLFAFDETLIIGEDYDLFSRIAPQYKIFNLQKVLYNYRKHGKSLTDNVSNWKTEQIDLIRKKYLESTGMRLEENQILFFIDFVMARPKQKVDGPFFRELSRIKRTFLENDFFDHRCIRSFFRESIHRYLLATKNYGFFAFIYLLAYYPSVFFLYPVKDSLRIIMRSLHA